MAEEFGKLFREVRLSRGYSLRAFCKLFSFDASNWSKIERGTLPLWVKKEDLEFILVAIGAIDDDTYTKVLESARQTISDHALKSKGYL